MKKPITSTPHDAVSRKFLSHPGTARDFPDSYFPTPLRKLCDLNTLKLESESLTEEDLRVGYSDVLWSLKTRTGKDYIYALIEHQSSPDAHMALRVMRYAIVAVQNHLDTGHKTLSLAVPILFYHGAANPYSFSLCWLDEFDDPGTARRLHGVAFPLVGIMTVSDDRIMQYRQAALLELVQKHICERDLMMLVSKLIALLTKGHANDSQVGTLFNYLVQSGSAPRLGAFTREVALHVPQHKERLVTIAKCLCESGQRIGLLEGKLEDKRKGKKDETLQTAHAMLEKGIDRELVLITTGLAIDELTVSSD